MHPQQATRTDQDQQPPPHPAPLVSAARPCHARVRHARVCNSCHGESPSDAAAGRTRCARVLRTRTTASFVGDGGCRRPRRDANDRDIVRGRGRAPRDRSGTRLTSVTGYDRGGRRPRRTASATRTRGRAGGAGWSGPRTSPLWRVGRGLHRRANAAVVVGGVVPRPAGVVAATRPPLSRRPQCRRPRASSPRRGRY